MTEPNDRTPPGTRVRLTEDVRSWGSVIPAGTEGFLKYRPFGPHATANGGGYDCMIVIPGRRFPSMLVDGQWVKEPVADASDSFTARSTSVEVIS